MAIPHTRLVIGGPTAGGDTWSCGLSLYGLEDATDTQLTDWLASVEADVAASYNSATDKWGSLAKAGTAIASLRAYTYPTGTGKAVAQAEWTYPTPVAGAGSGDAPGECCCVCSLYTGSPGRRNRGRIYVPADGAVILQSQFTAGQVGQVCNGVAQMIVNLNASSAPGGGNPIVVIAGPQQTGSGLDAGVYAIKVDSKPDVQRRREDKVVPLFTASTTTS